MRKNIVLSLVALTVLTGSSFAMGGFGESMMQQDQNMMNSHMNQAQQQVVGQHQKMYDVVHQFKQEAKNEFKTLREKIHQFRKQMHEKLHQIMDPEQRKEIIRQLRKQFVNDFQTFKQKIRELKEQLLTATAEQRKEIKEKIRQLREKFLQQMAEKLPADERQKFEQFLQQKEQLQQQFKQQIQQNYKYLTQTLEQRIDTILNQRLFEKIKNLSTEKQEQVLEKILNKVDAILARLQQNQNQDNPRVQIKIEVLQYLKQKVQEKLNDIKGVTSIENNVNEIINSILGGN